MPQLTNCKIRPMTRAEFDIVITWAAAEGWNPGLPDPDVFWQTDPEGYFALEHNGEMIGSGSAVSYDGQFGFMGFFIVKPEYRGKGMGGQLWLTMRDTLRERLNPGTAIGIDGVFNMQQTYAKTGFVYSHRTLRMEGLAENDSTSAYDLEAIKPVVAEEIEALIEADSYWFGFKRQRLLSAWLKMKDSHSLVYKDASKILGYGTIRPSQKGFKIAPLFATSAEIADQLYRALTAKVSGQVVYLDVPEINKEAMALAARHQLSECFGCARMYLGPAPALDYNQIYGSTTYELG